MPVPYRCMSRAEQEQFQSFAVNLNNTRSAETSQG